MPRTDQEDRIAKVREELPHERETIAASEEVAGDPERPDHPLGVWPPDDDEKQLPGFPREDPSQG